MTIDSEKEVGVVNELFGRYIKNYSSTQNIAVGFHDLYKKDVFTSINDDLLEFQNWAPGEPNNFEGKERCGGAYITAKFNDIPCDSLNPFICEYKSSIHSRLKLPDEFMNEMPCGGNTCLLLTNFQCVNVIYYDCLYD
uniref:C-type lectin domain-containing protein n=2 Tax=Timema TaxID=61471 RepID=A0A7R9P2A9_9NEOP|nr:unnamed protein product [Timema tahoe]